MTNPEVGHSAFRVRPDQYHRCGGFTLLEIMIALLLLTVITTTSVSMLFLNIKGWERVSDSSDRQLAELLTTARVEQIIRNIIPLTWQQKNRARLLAFMGDAQQVQFIAPAPQQYQPGGLFEYRLSLEDDFEQGRMLLLHYTPHNPKQSQFVLPQEGRRRILLSGLEHVEFSFFGFLPNRNEAEWTDRWEPLNNNYPELVKISFTEMGMTIPHEKIVRIRRNDS
ncbi:MAG: prepilin-type N-terminal cleavage/methylation domain-containing protein [Candidatus Thiodiazotropha weberae]|nr:prepilin-type N-terminal cleavage/methylation domain-containing protein [Candidatus Thiodiazotropha endoloripes]MCG7900500.1 prepilin-type N-terminal cleavage/methylation domain-containing protein [Candidatus Thiodiazotropha weberae]MCG7901551.1 prepilin-type N-terminal cleavage/methylation domain-containing protein [Candidatus Thiodiazotropha weberae]MCG7915741.1 prepilin-type N-terminal cleavage/methylation domain-containing protein [Candidatus Thiodiazotropha weberae]